MIRTRDYVVVTADGFHEHPGTFFTIDGGALVIRSFDDTGSEILIAAYSASGWRSIEEASDAAA